MTGYSLGGRASARNKQHDTAQLSPQILLVNVMRVLDPSHRFVCQSTSRLAARAASSTPKRPSTPSPPYPTILPSSPPITPRNPLTLSRPAGPSLHSTTRRAAATRLLAARVARSTAASSQASSPASSQCRTASRVAVSWGRGAANASPSSTGPTSGWGPRQAVAARKRVADRTRSCTSRSDSPPSFRGSDDDDDDGARHSRVSASRYRSIDAAMAARRADDGCFWARSDGCRSPAAVVGEDGVGVRGLVELTAAAGLEEAMASASESAMSRARHASAVSGTRCGRVACCDVSSSSHSSARAVASCGLNSGTRSGFEAGTLLPGLFTGRWSRWI